MAARDAAVVDEAVGSQRTCAICGRPVVDLVRAVIQRRMLYHSPCWLVTVSAGRRSEHEVLSRPAP